MTGEPQGTERHQAKGPRNVARGDKKAKALDLASTSAAEAAGQKPSATITQPARGYSWPPFQPGHTLSLVHGADSERTIEAKAAELRPQLFEICPWIDPEKDVIAVARFLRAESRALILHGYITKLTEEKGPGSVPQRTWEQATAADRLAAQLGNVLGLDPTGRARLQQVAATTEATLSTLEDVRREGREARQRHQAVIDATAEPDEPADDEGRL